ncbi:MAG TPA: hypothetical protein VF258_10930 [Luteolibacter sp.]
MADSTKPSFIGGCFSKLLFLILLMAAVGLGTAAFLVTRPQDLSDLGGYGPTAKPLPEREMKAVLKNAIDRGFAVTLSEAEINQWLGRTLQTRQGGILKEKVTLDRVWVRLEEGRAEVVMERKLWGKPFTTSMYLQVERMEDVKGTVTEVHRHGGPYHPDLPKPPRGGRFGKLVVPQGFLILVEPAYEKLAAKYAEELELGFKDMSRISIEKGKLILDPREPLGQEGMPAGF